MIFAPIFRYSLSFALSFSFFSALAQSISGNLNYNNSRNLSYANVDIYKGDRLIASTFTDADGNYSVKLDTGTYRVEFLYAGFEKIVEEVKVDSDLSLTRNLNENKDDIYYRSLEERERKAEEAKKKIGHARGHAMAPSYMEDSRELGIDGPGRIDRAIGSPGMTRGAIGSPYTRDHHMHKANNGGVLKSDREVKAGQLTAGEINDFAKWKMWNDLTSDELYAHQKKWTIAPQNRYCVQIVDHRRQPLVNVKVDLINEKGETVFTALSDNTGKAELWSGLRDGEQSSGKFSILANYQGQSERIRKAKVFSDGVNKVVFYVDCYANFEVDIAFVVDATGSMSDELNFLKAELNDVIFQAKQIDQRLDFRFANVFYRDHGDDYLTRTQDFSRVLSESITFISDQYAGGGGDYEEAVEIALDSAIHQLNWNPEARARLLFLVLDAPPHNTPAIQSKLEKLIKAASEKGIRIVPLVASGMNKPGEYLMRALALATNGTYAFLTNHSGIGGKKMEPSTDTYEVELLNDLLIRIIRDFSYMPDCEEDLKETYTDPLDTIIVHNPNAQNDSIPQNGEIPNHSISWRYWPNPTSGIVNIEVETAVDELFITDLNGKILQRIENIQAHRASTVDLSNYSTGIYLIRYPVGKQWVSGKIVLVRS